MQVEGVPYQLEFYSTMFVRPEDYKPPKGRKKKKVRFRARVCARDEYVTFEDAGCHRFVMTS